MNLGRYQFFCGRPGGATALIAAAVWGITGPSAGAATISVSGMANIHGAGHAVAPDPGGEGGGILPPVITFAAGGAKYFTFNVFGSVTPNVDLVPLHSAEGGTDDDHTNILPFGGISGIQHSSRSMFLVGVFLDDNVPSDPAPATLSYDDGESFDDLFPLLGQVFFIGDGNKDSDGLPHRFHAPALATRLFLGFADAPMHEGLPGGFDDNGGMLCVKYEILPEPSAWALAVLGAALAAGRFARRGTRAARRGG